MEACLAHYIEGLGSNARFELVQQSGWQSLLWCKKNSMQVMSYLLFVELFSKEYDKRTQRLPAHHGLACQSLRICKYPCSKNNKCYMRLVDVNI